MNNKQCGQKRVLMDWMSCFQTIRHVGKREIQWMKCHAYKQ